MTISVAPVIHVSSEVAKMLGDTCAESTFQAIANGADTVSLDRTQLSTIIAIAFETGIQAATLTEIAMVSA